jgi:hypothetical protein
MLGFRPLASAPLASQNVPAVVISTAEGRTVLVAGERRKVIVAGENRVVAYAEKRKVIVRK